MRTPMDRSARCYFGCAMATIWSPETWNGVAGQIGRNALRTESISGATRSPSVEPAILSNRGLMRAWRRRFGRKCFSTVRGTLPARMPSASHGRKNDLAELDKLALLLSLNGRTVANSAIEAHRREEAPCVGWKPTAQPWPTLERERVRRSC